MMRRRSFLCGCVALLAAAPEAGGAAESSRLAVALGPDVDGIVFRGAWRAAVRRDAASGIAIEAPAAALARVRVTFADSTVTLHNDGVAAPSAFANVRSLRGVSTSGRVNLTIDDAAGGPLFLDLAGGGTARARGAVPLLRVTTSGTVRADLTGLTARIVRAHARQASRLALPAAARARIVALDIARVTYATPRARTDLRAARTATIRER